ncbi:HAD hydrolase-like protein [Notoacmeibacter sp. MSK16QG-6]|uniref:HAD hydrolase-like protein n=1 Tax=Notoacmeibacter sp. MSK16QG-6 TaxID=2957982 RepID=UPI00209FD760|nr:HAD hydrolase-like protein [Notoacmeibacter sp. MSK16QG-6]MCP1199474.1 HAD hydrolase-like protein [Notoacmeibacter sp. MSK16QG-6]
MRPTIVFDLDGTLVDTAPDLVDSLNHCLITQGLTPAREEDIRHYAGHGARVMLQRAFEAQDRLAELSEEMLGTLLDVFIDHYRKNIPGRSQPFPGAVAAMDRFAAAGWALAVCTNKFEGLAIPLLEGLGVKHRFAAIAGSDTFAYRKPDPRHLTDTITAAGGDWRNSILIGDSRTDVTTAKAAGVAVVAVTFGYSDTPVADLAPDHVIDHFDELTTALASELIACMAKPK